MPVIRPESAMRRVFCMASVRPASVPVISTMASFMPSTMLPTYDRRSSSSIASSACSCDSSSARMLSASGASFASSSYEIWAFSSPRSISLTANVKPNTRAIRENRSTLPRWGFIASPV